MTAREWTEMDSVQLGNNILKFIYVLSRMNIPRGTSGKMDCPICEGKGTVSYHRVDFNGHIHAGCSSCGFNVME